MEKNLENLIDKTSEKHGVEYAEARIQKISKTMLTLKDGKIENVKQGIEKGAALRVLIDGAWGFASVGSLNQEKLKNGFSVASSMAKSASLKIKKKIVLAPIKVVKDEVKIKAKKKPSEISIEDKINLALNINESVLSHDKKIRSCTVDYFDLNGENFFLNNEGTEIKEDKLCVWSKTTACAKQNGKFTFSRDEVGSTTGYEIFDSEKPEIIGKRVAKRAINQLIAKPAKGGKFPVILGPNVVGVFVHEAFGHLAEADLALSGGLLVNKIGKKVASEVVTLYDNGTIKGAFGSYKYDDEGVPAQNTVLIEDGNVSSLIHNRESAREFNVEPTGNARAEDFRNEPIIRMRNTYMAPRDYSLKELLEDIKFGYYFKSYRGGQANIDGTFQVGIQEGYEIVNGEIAKPVLEASFSGSTLDTLFKVDAAGKELELGAGRCGKGQTAYVGDGGPHIRVKEVVVGGSI